MTKKNLDTVRAYVLAYAEYKQAEAVLQAATPLTLAAIPPGTALLGVRHVVARLLRPNEAALKKSGHWDKVRRSVVDIAKLHHLLELVSKREARKLAKFDELHRLMVISNV